MKSYTDLEQSKKLAEILSSESADMCYIKHASSYNPNWEFNEDFPPMILGNVPINEVTAETLPCWSLTALIEILPNNIVIDGHKWWLSITKKSISYLGSMTWDGQLNISVKGDNLIDACYEMIIKLHELNLL